MNQSPPYERIKAKIEQQLYRCTCPDVETLVAYQEGRLVSTACAMVQVHIAGCALCQEEIYALNTIDALPLLVASLVAMEQHDGVVDETECS